MTDEVHPKFDSEHDRIKQLIVRVGDQGQEHFKRDITKLLSNTLKYASASEENKEFVINAIVECASLLTQKASIYATYIALMTIQSSALAENTIERLLEQLQKSLDRGDISTPKSLLMVFGELMNLGVFNSFVFINMLFDVFNEAEKSLNASKDYYLSIGISILPYVIEGLMKKSQLELKNLLQLIKTLMAKRDLKYIDVIRVYKEKASTDRLSQLWNAIVEFVDSEDREQIKTIPRPYHEFEEELSSLTQMKKSMAKIYFNNKVAEYCVYQSPCYFQLFDESTLINEVKSRLDRLILKEQITDILILFQHNKKLILQKLFTLNSDYKCETLIADTVIGEMFRLPNSECKLVFYSSILIGLTVNLEGTATNNFDQIIRQAANSLFEEIDQLDIELVDRFIAWFSHYLANFKYEWEWSKWAFVKELDDDQTKRVFVKHLLIKLCNISFKDRIKEVVPEELHPLLPEDATIIYRFDNPQEVNYADAEVIKDKLNSKISAEDMLKFFKEDTNALVASEELQSEIFLESLLQRGSKALSHFHTLIQRYLYLLEELFKKENDQYIILDTIKRCWKNSTFHQITLIDELMSYKLINYRLIINWVFQEIEKGNEQSDHCKKYWDILLNVIIKTLGRSDAVKTELRKAKLKNNAEEIPKLEKMLETVVEEERAMFDLIFRKFWKLFSDYHNKDKAKYNMAFQRFVQLARKYRKDIEVLLAKIDEDYSKLDLPELKQTVERIKELK